MERGGPREQGTALPFGIQIPTILRSRKALTTGLVLTTFGVALETLSVLPVAPQVASELPDGLALYSWVFAGFFLGSAVAIPLVGPVVDRRGPVGVFAIGIVAFTVGLLIAGAASSMSMLVVGRVIQGAGSGIIGAVSFATVALAYEPARRPRVLALMSSAWLLPSVLGPLYGGLVAHTLGWRWVFLGLATLMPLAAMVVLPAMLALRDRLGPIVPPGTPDPEGGLLRRLRHVVPPEPGVRAGALLLLLAAATINGVITFASLGLAEVRGLDPLATGLTLAVLSIAWGVGSISQDRLADRIPVVRTARIGTLLMLIGLPLVALTVAIDVPVALTWLGWVACGFGAGWAFQAANLHVMANAGSGGEGRATAAAQLANTIGAASGAWALGLVLTTLVDGGTSLPQALTVVFVGCIGVALAGVLVARGLRPPSTSATSSVVASAHGRGP